MPVKSSDYADIFLPNLVMDLPMNIDMNKHVIEVINRKQSPYGSIYALTLVD